MTDIEVNRFFAITEEHINLEEIGIVAVSLRKWQFSLTE